MIKAIIFDLSGVCSNNEEPPFVQQFALKHHLPLQEFEQDYLHLIVTAERDQISGTQVWEKLAKKYAVAIDIPKTIKEMIEQKVFYPELLHLASSLRKRYHTAVLSNYNKTYWDLISKKIDLSKYFDVVLISYQIKARKDSPLGFQKFLQQFKIKPQEALYFDDTKHNLATPASLGLKTIHFLNKAQLLKEMKKYGITF